MPTWGMPSLRFSARIQGSPYEVNVPVVAVLAIYARENGQGIFFKEPNTPPEPDAVPDSTPQDKAARSKPSLKLVK